MKKVPTVFKSDIFGDIRVVIHNGEEHFLVTDICKALHIANSRNAFNRIDERDKDTVHSTDSIGRARNFQAVNESGLYQLVFMSKKKEARDFTRWVTKVILPTLRKTGEYRIQKEYWIEKPGVLGGGYTKLTEEEFNEQRLNLMDEWLDDIEEQCPALFGRSR